MRTENSTCAFYLFIRQPHGSEVSPAARNTLDSARIPRASKLLICGPFQKGRVLAQDGIEIRSTERTADTRVDGLGIEQVLTAPRSPWQNPFVERMIGSIRRECLDHVIVLDERHLKRILRKYVDYYHSCRDSFVA